MDGQGGGLRAPGWRGVQPRRVSLVAAIAAITAMLFAGCAARPAPERYVPPRPQAMTAEQIRTIDVCALISEYVLQQVFATDGPAAIRRGIGSNASGCDVFIPSADADHTLPAYAIALAPWPAAGVWPRLTSSERSSKTVGGWLLAGPDSGPQTMFAYSERGVAYEIVPLKPRTSELELRREKAIMSLLLGAMAKGALPTIPWADGSVFTRDICAAAKAAGLPRLLSLTDPTARPLIASSPDARSCSEERPRTSDQPRFTVSAGLVDGLDTSDGAVATTVAGHDAVQKGDGTTCRLTVSFPGDPALDERFADVGSRVVALSVSAARPCPQLVKATAPLIEELETGS